MDNYSVATCLLPGAEALRFRMWVRNCMGGRQKVYGQSSEKENINKPRDICGTLAETAV
jgi:hypothetical protein